MKILNQPTVWCKFTLAHSALKVFDEMQDDHETSCSQCNVMECNLMDNNN